MRKEIVSKPVLCVELSKRYFNARYAGEELNIIPNNIRECCRGIRKTAGGYHWKETGCVTEFIPEGFVEINGIPNLFINRNGDIYSLYYNKILKQQISDRGYSIIRIKINNKKKTLKVHRLVAKTFLPNPNNYEEVNHKDENKLNNNINNLEWCDRKYNMNYGTVQKRIKNTKKLIKEL